MKLLPALLAYIATLGVVLSAHPVAAATFSVDDFGVSNDVAPGDGVCATSSGTCTWKAALTEANQHPGPDAINVPAGTWYAGSPFYVSDDLEVHGVGASTTAATIFDGNNNSRVFSATAPLTLVGLTVQNGNYLNTGGGVRSQSSPLTVRDCTFRNNRAGNTGGAMSVDGRLTISGSTFVGNRSGNTGAAVRVHSSSHISNTTFFDNRAGNTGGAISSAAHATLVNVTVTGNSGAALRSSESRFTISHSILWNNEGVECSAEAGVFSGGHNVFDSDVCEIQNGLQPSDVVGLDPLLGPLQDNGGSTDTMALGDGSAALDAAGDNCEPTDQRGISRPQDVACDAGAFEKIACNYDGVLDPSEQCDDGNTDDGDGCSALCETELISGHRFSMKVDSNNVSRAKLIAQSKDKRIRLGWGNGSADDPVLHGATARVVSHEGAGFDVLFNLPAENWDYVGKAGRNRGYRYKDKDGTVAKITVRPGKGIKVKAKGSALAMGLGVNPNPVHFVLSIGSREYCASFGGDAKFKPQRLFKAKAAPAPSEQPAL